MGNRRAGRRLDLDRPLALAMSPHPPAGPDLEPILSADGMRALRAALASPSGALR